MKISKSVSLLFIAALALAACGQAADRSDTPDTDEIPPGAAETEAAMQPAGEPTIGVTPVVIPTGTPGASAAGTAGVPVTGAVIIRVVQQEAFGSILVDGDGFTLYIFTGEGQPDVSAVNENSNTNGNENDNSNTNDNANANDNANDNENFNDNSNGNDNGNVNGNGNTNDNTNTSEARECTVNCWIPVITGGGPIADDGLNASLLGTTAGPDGSVQVTYNGWPLYRYRGDLMPGDINGQGADAVWFMVSPLGNPVLD